ncbi:IclR family transcriptional regulator [Streptomyces sp. NPDC059814]|uniref:IclR family transcriptional regulator n=1 Tax=Streptomyces sp. NPDC059814 TaxID=3346959 RepID=UPI0036525E90
MVKAVNTRSVEQEPVKGPVDKAMEVLEALVQPGAPHRLGEIARRTSLAKPTVHRLLRTMAEHGFAEPEEGGSYRAGPRLLGLAAAALNEGRVLELAGPVLADLRRRTGHVASFAVRHDSDAVYLVQSEPAREYRTGTRPGHRTPLYASGVGLAMLSALPAGEAAALLGTTELDARTPRTPTEPAALQELVAEAARCGYAVDDEYDEPDMRSVAAPVLGPDGRVAGAIGISGPMFTMDAANLETFGPMVRAAARTVSAGLGARTPTLGSMGTVIRGELA